MKKVTARFLLNLREKTVEELAEIRAEIKENPAWNACPGSMLLQNADNDYLFYTLAVEKGKEAVAKDFGVEFDRQNLLDATDVLAFRVKEARLRKRVDYIDKAYNTLPKSERDAYSDELKKEEHIKAVEALSKDIVDSGDHD